MGMNFSPMYQPVSTKTIKADGDLNVSPYDVIGYDGHFDTVEADEFVGGVGNFSSLVMPTLGYNGFVEYSVIYDYSGASLQSYTQRMTLLSSPFPINGVVSLKISGVAATLEVLSINGKTETTLTTTQTEYSITNAYNIGINFKPTGSSASGKLTFGIPKFT